MPPSARSSQLVEPHTHEANEYLGAQAVCLNACYVCSACQHQTAQTKRAVERMPWLPSALHHVTGRTMLSLEWEWEWGQQPFTCTPWAVSHRPTLRPAWHVGAADAKCAALTLCIFAVQVTRGPTEECLAVERGSAEYPQGQCLN